MGSVVDIVLFVVKGVGRECWGMIDSDDIKIFICFMIVYD